MEKASKRTNGRRVGVKEPHPLETDSVRHESATLDSAHHSEPKRPWVAAEVWPVAWRRSTGVVTATKWATSEVVYKFEAADKWVDGFFSADSKALMVCLGNWIGSVEPVLVFLTTLKPLPAPRGSIGGGVVLDTSGGTACFRLDGILGGVATGTPTLGADDEVKFPFFWCSKDRTWDRFEFSLQIVKIKWRTCWRWSTCLSYRWRRRG